MTVEFQEVRPGQVISSALFNSLFTTLMTRMDDLEARVADLEAGSGGGADSVAITGFSPPSQQKVNEAMVILGRGFIFPPATGGVPPTGGVPTNNVMINGVQITAFLFDSTTDRLSFLIPSTLNITTSTVVTVEVSNELGESQPRSYTLLPPDPVTVPQPTVAQVSPVGNPALANKVFVEQMAVIDGTNFLTQASKVTVSFTIPAPAGGSSHIYPADPKTVTVESSTRLQVMVPPIPEVPAVGDRTVIVSVLCTGNAMAGTKMILARRS